MHLSDDHQHAKHPDVVVDRGDEGYDLSGIVILRLSDRLDPGESPDLRDHAEALGLRSLVQYLDELGQPSTQRAVTSVAPRKLLQQEEQAKALSLHPRHSLTRYWRIDAHELPQRLEKIVERFSQLDDVELAYAEIAVSEPAASVVMNPLNGEQRYLDAAPNGIGARWAWNQPGGKGKEVGLADIERGWRLSHQDLSRQAASTLVPVTARDANGHTVVLANQDGLGGYTGFHGTAVLGVIAARDNNLGVIGIAPSLRSLRVAPIFDGTSTTSVGNALIAASEMMSVGDVLLLEVARGGARQDQWPTEIHDFDFDAIRHVTARGRIVIEAAGNGGMDLASWPGAPGGRRLITGNPDWDSRAIMVGACQTDPVLDISRERYATSNYGDRVNCFAWGQWVTTCWVAEPGLPTMHYTNNFSGTSSAAAIVAGATVLVQSMNLARRPGEPSSPRRKPLWPRQMRSILSDHNNGTPQGPLSAAENIGSMPDLKKIKTNVLDLIPLP